MHITLKRDNDDLIVQVDGLLSFHHHREGDELIDGISKAITDYKPKHLRFDMSKTLSLDSHWLGIFIRIFRRAKEQQIGMSIEKASADVQRLFSIVQIDRIIEVRA
ncbi:MAG: STAS domain-containing protein [Alphaproteobacteria bacterium]